MSRKRQPIHVCPRLPSPVTALAYDLGHGYVIPEHLHPEDQLVYACKGVMTVRTSAGTWVVPAQRAVWIPARTPHSILMSGVVSMRTIYLRARQAQLPRACCVVNVSPLLQHLIVHLCTVGKLSRRSKTHAHLIDVLIDQLETVQADPLQLPSPTDPRAARVVWWWKFEWFPFAVWRVSRLGPVKERSKDCSQRETGSRWENGESSCD
jgi:hypothetical protein